MASRSLPRWLSIAAGTTAAAYAAYVAIAWSRYGHAPRSAPESADRLLDRFMPDYEVAERHHIRVGAPAAATFEAACNLDLTQSLTIQAIFKAREILLGSSPDAALRPRGMLPLMKSFGWGVLAEAPGREIVLGAVTRPWEADVVFRAVPSDAFAAFDEPGYVKIAWTLRADPLSPAESVFRSETRAIATDPWARAKFRRYWAFLSPGITAIRWMTLCPVKKAAEGR